MKNNDDICIYGDGNQLRDFIYVSDISNIVAEILASDIKNEIFNFSINKGISVNELFYAMKNIYNYTKEPIHMPERAEEIKESILSNTRIMQKFPNIKFKDLSEGLQEIKNTNYD